MAGEDPGASTIAVLLDAIQRAWGAVTGSVKAVTGGVMDVIKTGMFIRWRRQMMQSSSKLKHGYQSLKKLRRHEDHGAVLNSIEIGTKEDARLFKAELKRAGIDFALTHDENDVYTLHYKTSNEKDVLHAQYSILEQRYGTPTPTEQETPSLTSPEESAQERDQKTSDERDRSEESLAIPARTDEPERTTPRTPLTPSVTDTVRAEAHAQEPESNATLIPKNVPVSNEPLSELKRQAQERARAKNLARSQNKGLSHSRHANRIRARELSHGH